MKKRLLFLLAGIILSMGSSLHAQAYTKITFGWTNTNTAVPLCSATVTKSCLKNITISDTTALTTVSATIAPDATSFVYTPPAGTLIFGYSHTFTITVAAIGGDGSTVTTTPLSTTVTNNSLLPPTGFGGVLTP